MNKPLKFILLAFLTLLTTIAGIMYYRLGTYKEVVIEYSPPLTLHLVYKKHIGPYHEVVTTLTEVESWARDNQIPCHKSFGEYLDNPEVTPEDRLRSHVGCVLDTQNTLPLPKDFYYEKKEINMGVRAHFEGSPAVSPIVVYPKVKSWAQKNKITLKKEVLEIYQVSHGGDHIENTYYFYIEN